MAAAKTVTLDLPELNIDTITLPIVGTGGLICHAWSKKAREQMLAKQMKKASVGKTAKDPFLDFCESLYWLDGMPAKPTQDDVDKARFGFPTVALKSAAITAVTTIGAMTKVMARQCFHLVGEHVELIGPPPSMREDMVRVGMGSADIRFRGEFMKWGALLTIQHNANVISAEQVATLIHAGGFGVGIGDWRPEKDGISGRFRVGSQAELEALR